MSQNLRSSLGGVELNSDGAPLIYRTTSQPGQVDAITGATFDF